MTRDELREILDRVAASEASLRSGWVHQLLLKVGPTRPFAAVYRRLGPMIDPWLLRRTGGRIATKLYGFPALLLRTTGSKSGLMRVSPLFYAREGDDFVVVGTNFGTEHHPAWTTNLLKQPSAEIVVGADTLGVRGELLDDATFALLWPRFTKLYPGYGAYLERLERRKPRMFKLRPVHD